MDQHHPVFLSKKKKKTAPAKKNCSFFMFGGGKGKPFGAGKNFFLL
jgi:hypothetical protein